MTRLLKGALAMQFAIAGVALAQTNNDAADRPEGATRGLNDLLNTGSDTSMPAGTVRASTLVGAEVYNHAGKHLGEIKDIVLDKNSKRVGYAVLSYGGIAGLGDKLFAMPQKMLRYNAGDNRVTVSLDENVLKNAPGFDQSKWPTEANADYYRKLDDYYRDKADGHADAAKDQMDHAADAAKEGIDKSARTAGDRLDDAADHGGQAVKDAGKAAGETMKDAGERASDRLSDADDDQKLNTQHDVTAQPAGSRMDQGELLTWNRRVSSVIGANVENAQGENLGEVHDIVLDWGKGEVRYAVLSYGGVLGIGDKLFAVPIDAFQHNQEDSVLVLNASKDRLKDAPGFNRDQWPNMADPQWTKQVSDFYKDDAGQKPAN